MHPAPISKKIIPPDEQTACFDFLYYTGSANTFEWEKDYNPTWRFVGTHMRWNATLEERAKGYLRRLFSVQKNKDIPPVRV
jgi:hypothetical protein